MLKYISLFVLLNIVGLVFYFQTDKVYLERKTIKLLNAISSSHSPVPQMALMKVNEIAKYMHFSVKYEVNFNQKLYQDHSLAQLRSALFAYFQVQNEIRIHNPKNKDIHIAFSMQEGHKAAEIDFPVKITWHTQDFLCRVHMNWEKETHWLARKIKVFACSSEFIASVEGL